MFPIQGSEVPSVHQVAFEWLEDCAHVPLRSIFVLQQVFDAGPLRLAIVFAAKTFVKKFAMLLAHISVVSSAMLNLHSGSSLSKNVIDYNLAKIIPLDHIHARNVLTGDRALHEIVKANEAE
jgi:hypothetical protein